MANPLSPVGVTWKPEFNLESPEFIKVIVIGYGISIAAVFLTPLISSGHRLACFKNPTVLIPTLFLLFGFASPFLVPGGLVSQHVEPFHGIKGLFDKPGSEDVSPFNPATATGLPFNPAAITGFVDRGDVFCLARLGAWYNYHAIGNPIGGPIINAFALLGMLFASKSQGGGIVTKAVVMLSLLGCTALHLHWAYKAFDATGGVEAVKGIAQGGKTFDAKVAEAGIKNFATAFWKDTMFEKSDAPAYPGFHEGKKGYMPASYAVDYFGMCAVSLVYGIFGAEGFFGKIKHIFVTVLFGGATGLIFAVKDAMLPDKSRGSSPVTAIPFLLTALGCIYVWLPFQMLWIDYVVTPHGRLNGGLINPNVKYCTLSVVAPYFALCALAIAAYGRQNMPTLLKGVAFFNACAFLFFQIAAASAIMIGMCYFWGVDGASGAGTPGHMTTGQKKAAAKAKAAADKKRK